MSALLSPLARPVPETKGARLDAAHQALAALEGEGRRLERLGFELPLARCQEQIRFWRFVTSVLSLPGEGDDRSRGARG